MSPRQLCARMASGEQYTDKAVPSFAAVDPGNRLVKKMVKMLRGVIICARRTKSLIFFSMKVGFQYKCSYCVAPVRILTTGSGSGLRHSPFQPEKPPGYELANS